ncbi:MAG: hypothetical protein MJ162_04645 [Treponema sp.]|nr:hypothetical protein [Treponema sp.]
MKFRKLFFVLIPFLFLSCVWSPVDQRQVLRKKNSCKAFDHLTDPIVYELDLYQIFKSGNVTHSEKTGNLLVVYDWENNQFFDHAYTSQFYVNHLTGSMKEIPAAAGKTEYYHFGTDYKDLRVLSSDGQVRKLESPVLDSKAFIISDYQNSVDKKLWQIVQKEYSDGIYTCGLCYFDSATGQLVETDSFITSDTWSIGLTNDSSGNNYITYKTKQEKRTLQNICSVSKEGKIQSSELSIAGEDGNYDEYNGWDKSFSYTLKYADSGIFIFSKTTRTPEGYGYKYAYSLLVYNRSSESFEEIQCPENSYISEIYCLNENLYASLGGGGKSVSIAKIDLLANTITKWKECKLNAYHLYGIEKGDCVYWLVPKSYVDGEFDVVEFSASKESLGVVNTFEVSSLIDSADIQ